MPAFRRLAERAFEERALASAEGSLTDLARLETLVERADLEHELLLVVDELAISTAPVVLMSMQPLYRLRSPVTISSPAPRRSNVKRKAHLHLSGRLMLSLLLQSH